MFPGIHCLCDEWLNKCRILRTEIELQIESVNLCLSIYYSCKTKTCKFKSLKLVPNLKNAIIKGFFLSFIYKYIPYKHWGIISYYTLQNIDKIWMDRDDGFRYIHIYQTCKIFPMRLTCSKINSKPDIMMIWKRPAPWDDHLQEAGPSGWKEERKRCLQIIICKWLAPKDYHLRQQ